MKAHGKFLKDINLKLDARISPGVERELDAHLETCDACRREYEMLSSLRQSLLKTPDVPVDREKAEMQVNSIMALVRDRAASGKRPTWAPALRPLIGVATVAIIIISTMTMMKQPSGPSNRLFTNPDDMEFDTMLVHEILNQHEIATVFEVFNQPLLIAGEVEANNQILEEGKG